MANWIDIFSFSLTVSIIGGIIYAIVLVSQKINESMSTTKENLKNKGYTISSEGVSVKTSKRFDRSDYVDATQRGFVKAFGASHFGKDHMGQGQGQQAQSSGAKKKRN